MSTKGKFHITKRGEPALCNATVQDCPLGDLGHHDSFEAAQAAYEKSMEPSLFVKMLRRGALNWRKGVAVGGAILFAASISACKSDITVPEEPAEVTSSEDFEVEESSFDDGASELVEGQQASEVKEAFASVRDGIDSKADSINVALQNAKKEVDKTSKSSSKKTSSSKVYFQGKLLNPSAAEVTAAKAILKSLKVKPEFKGGKYNRADQFGRAFKTGVVGRTERRDIKDGIFRNASPQARAVGGSFIDPYTNQTVTIVPGSSYDADVDHVVPLKEAFDSGAMKLSKAEREALANDPDNLQMVGWRVNRTVKVDKDAADYIPSYAPAKVPYVIAQIKVKKKYNLSIDSREAQAMQKVLASYGS